jgi:hypothetical protein
MSTTASAAIDEPAGALGYATGILAPGKSD